MNLLKPKIKHKLEPSFMGLVKVYRLASVKNFHLHNLLLNYGYLRSNYSETKIIIIQNVSDFCCNDTVPKQKFWKKPTYRSFERSVDEEPPKFRMRLMQTKFLRTLPASRNANKKVSEMIGTNEARSVLV